MAVPVLAALGTVSNGGSATTVDLPVPSGVTGTTADGEIILAFVYVETPQTVTPPAGFAEDANSPRSNAASGQTHALHVLWKRPTAADTGNYTFTIAAGLTWRRGIAARFTGCVGTGNPFDASNSAAKTTTADGTTPNVSLTTTGIDRLLVWNGVGFSTGTCSTVTGFTEVFDFGTDKFAIDTKNQATAAATGSLSATFSGSSSTTAWLGALLPAVAAPGQFFAMF